MQKDFENFLDNIDIKLGDKLYISSDIIRILLFHRTNKTEFNPNDFKNKETI